MYNLTILKFYNYVDYKYLSGNGEPWFCLKCNNHLFLFRVLGNKNVMQHILNSSNMKNNNGNLKILRRANSLIANNNIRSVILEIKNDRSKTVKILIFPSLSREHSREREQNISILTILDLSFLISNMTLLILLFAIRQWK